MSTIQLFKSPSLATWAFVFFSLLFSASVNAQKVLYQDVDLKVVQVRPNIWVHESYIIYKGDTVGCNGMVYLQKGKAMVFDCPTTDAAAEKLIKLICHGAANSQKNKAPRSVAGVVVNHFHNDCLGSLVTFHKHKIKSYASNKTIELAKTDSTVKAIPQVGFDSLLVLNLGDKQVVNRFFGPAHTQDNITSYVPSEKVLFGGCQVKCLNADKGYLGDADTSAWSSTTLKLKKGYPQAKLVIPGHGQWGGVELLDYTERLFR